MVKYGKLFRELQIKEFKDKYINYKKLKQKIKKIEKLLPRTSQKLIKNRESNISNLKLRPTLSSEFDENESNPTTDQYGEQLKEFQKLLDEEFMRCYMYFKKIRKQLHSKINVHLYTQTNYISYTLEEILKEVNNLRNTTYLAKCLNAFINDNMMAIKKILKKFDKKFSNYFGNIGPKYILDNLSKQNSDLEYLLQFKIIDETSCICESNLKLLTECYREINNPNRINNDNDNDNENEFEKKASQITEYLKDIAELIYFKIQYKEWFYYSKKNASIISNSKLFNNLMFNPILFSAYHKDDLCNKFLSRKDALKEIEQIQPSISLYNLINIILIFIHTFFYNTLISGIYPLLFEYIGEIYDKTYLPYSLLIIASTYFFSYFSIFIYHYFGARNIKIAYFLSYIIFLLGSIVYIINYKGPDGLISLKDFSFIGYLIFSRILIGLGAIPTLGKKYILSYAPKYFLPFISKIYFLFSIIGHSVGPLIGFFLFDLENVTFLKYFYISKYNCIGWYGLIMSFLLLIIHLILFTSPYSSKFSRLKGNNTKVHYGTFTSQDSQFLVDDLDDNQDKEFYRLQKEMKVKKLLDNDSDLNDDLLLSYKEKNDDLLKRNFSLSEEEEEQSKKDNEDTKSERKNGNVTKINNILRKSNTLMEENKIIDDIANYDKINPLLISTNYNNEIKDESQQESTSFVHINMIPRTIEDLIRKEKKTFGYLNKNLLIILIILFFNNLLKENFIAYCSYYIYYSITSVEKNKGYIQEKYLSCLISLSYFLEILSMPFILPFYKLNTQIKKLLIALMIITILLMIPLSIEYVVDNIIIYFIIISLVFLISSIIEVLSSCYLAYLTPPEWKFSRFNAGALPLYVMTFGKLCGCLICFTAFTSNLLLNHHIIISLTILGYGISGIFILKSKNFRIKAIARIMRKTELEQGIF